MPRLTLSLLQALNQTFDSLNFLDLNRMVIGFWKHFSQRVHIVSTDGLQQLGLLDFVADIAGMPCTFGHLG
jgi:hypothetical protein